MRKWIWATIILIVAAAIWSGWPYAYFAYRLYFHGPGALERAEVSRPVALVRYGPAQQQFAELRLPTGNGPFPVAVLLHGGCWDVTIGGNAKQMRPLADALGKRGIATLNVEYRQLGEPGGGWPGTMRDAGLAIDGVRALAKLYPLDAKRLIVVGHSAGAQMALWSAVRGKLTPASDLYAADPLVPKAVVAIDGPGALAEFIGIDKQVCNKSVIVPFMGGTPQAVPQHYRDASPQDHLPLGARQVLAQAALGDLMQPYVDKAKAAGDPVDVYAPKDGKHFDIINPTQEQGAGTVTAIVKAVEAMK